MWNKPQMLPDGHRLFESDENRYAIADESGFLPNNTDDGVLWLDFTRPLSVEVDNSFNPPREYFNIPLTDESGKDTRTTTNVRTLALLATKFNWPVEIGEAMFKFEKLGVA